MTLQYSEGDEQIELIRVEICPQHFPKTDDLVECEFALERNEDPADYEKEVEGACAVLMSVFHHSVQSRWAQLLVW